MGEARAKHAEFTRAFSDPELLDAFARKPVILRDPVVPKGFDICGRAVDITVRWKGRDTLGLAFQYDLLVKRQRCNTRETWNVRRRYYGATNVYRAE